LEDGASSTAQKNINLKVLRSLPIPLPPLPEQKRIVARVEELTDLCNRLEKAHQTRNKLRDDFTASALDNLTQAKTPDQLKPAWTIIKNNFPTITATPDSIQKLRQTILQLAVQGMLASVSATRTWQQEYPLALPSDYLNIPDDWKFITLDQVSTDLRYGTSKKSQKEGNVPVLRMGNLQSGKIDWSDLKYTDDEEDVEKFQLESGDLLFNRTNSPALVGKTSIFLENRPVVYAGYLIRVKLDLELVEPHYANMVLNSDYAVRWRAAVKSDGVSQSNINAKKLAKFQLPLPSLEEQNVIVARVNELMAICDKLEEALKSKEQKAASFAQSLIAHELNNENSGSKILVEA